MTFEEINNYLENKINYNPDFVVFTFYEVRIKLNLSSKESLSFLHLVRTKLENNGYKIYTPGQVYTYKTKKQVVDNNELLVAIIKSKEIIVGYYGQAFFGGGNYLKLSKEKDDSKYKFEYIHSVIPNYISNAEEYIKKSSTLPISKMKAGKNNTFTIENSPYIDKILEIIKNTDWNYISKQEYTSEDLDDECWKFYIKYDNLEYLIKGYAVHPKEIENIYDLLKKMNDIKEQDKNARK